LITLPYKTLKLLGWTTVILVSLSATFYFLLLINKKIQRSKSNHPITTKLKRLLRKLIPFIHSYHSALGAAALITGIVHGYSLLQSVEFHSGYLLWISISFMGITGLSMKISKTKSFYKRIRMIHRVIMFITLLLLTYHILSMKLLL